MPDDAAAESLPGLLARGTALAERLVAENDRLRRELAVRAAESHHADEENHELASLYIAARQMHGSHEPRGVLGAVVEILVNFVGAKTFAIYLRDDTSGLLRPVVAEGLTPDALPPAGPETTVAQVVADREVRLTDDLTAAEPSGPPRLAVPLCLGDDAVGALAIWSFLAHKTALHDVDRALLDLISTHAARALEAARLAAGTDAARLDYATVANLL